MQKKKRVSTTHEKKIIPIQMDATFFFERAVQSLDRFHYDKALKYFRRAVEYEDDNPVNYCNLAGVLSEMGQYEESNMILQQIMDDIDPKMTECYFYMANNYANMEDYELAEKALVRYLENDPSGNFLEESQEMMELLSYELGRPAELCEIKSREGLFEHDKVRLLLEEGKFAEAVKLLEELVRKKPDFLAARNNLALAYYYTGHFERALDTILEVLDMDPGNLHGLCNLAIFYQHLGRKEDLEQVLTILRKTYPYQQEHVFKLATTMGILGEHTKAYQLFRRLIRTGEAGLDPCLYHYTAVAACNLRRFAEAERLWGQVERLEPGSVVAKFYLDQMKRLRTEEGKKRVSLSYHYHLPFEEQLRQLERSANAIPEHLQKDPLVRSSFFWALRYSEPGTKLQVIQALGRIGDNEVIEALKDYLLQTEEEDYLKRVAIFVLRSIGVTGPLEAHLNGGKQTIESSFFTSQLPRWDEKWQEVLETAHRHMYRRYDIVQQHDLETLWVEYLTRVYPEVPRISKAESWSAALEYLIAKMHRRAVTYQDVASRYGTTVSTVSRHVKMLDTVCGIREKIEAIFPAFLKMDPHHTQQP
ncbi:tetratricopeptide repeat protein [Paenibacillus larvae]|uniref:tetratricopeptide repeat protein n=1 Tax=Paenibacillus larvae TaxID=1464 RepID=UPI00227E83D9|nr:tetratricopeptide repeat protein [Paenibacillus larvae]MCY7478029.1 tetratricopeptide repeat protein [Paenibacillus larvae]MDE5166691.1 tetratricopeptide repeat protein [Paenibacillus larvae subsp. larvae]